MCLTTLLAVRNFIAQILHSYGWMPECMRSWILRFGFVFVVNVHCEHLKSFDSIWTTRWLFAALVVLNFLPQTWKHERIYYWHCRPLLSWKFLSNFWKENGTSQVYGRSLVCDRMWIAKEVLIRNHLQHLSHWYADFELPLRFDWASILVCGFTCLCGNCSRALVSSTSMRSISSCSSILTRNWVLEFTCFASLFAFAECLFNSLKYETPWSICTFGVFDCSCSVSKAFWATLNCCSSWSFASVFAHKFFSW